MKLARLSAAIALTGLLALPAMAAKRAPVTITVVGTTDAKILVNGKAYVPGTPLPRHAKITVIGGTATLQIGATTVTTQGDNTALSLSGGSLSVETGTVQVTPANGQPQTLASGQSVNVAPAPANNPQGNQNNQNTVQSNTQSNVPPPPPPSAEQNQQATVSPSAP